MCCGEQVVISLFADACAALLVLTACESALAGVTLAWLWMLLFQFVQCFVSDEFVEPVIWYHMLGILRKGSWQGMFCICTSMFVFPVPVHSCICICTHMYNSCTYVDICMTSSPWSSLYIYICIHILYTFHGLGPPSPHGIPQPPVGGGCVCSEFMVSRLPLCCGFRWRGLHLLYRGMYNSWCIWISGA